MADIDIEAPGADLAELVDAIKSLASLEFRDIVVITANTLLDSTHYGKALIATVAGITIIYPPAPAITLPNEKVPTIDLKNASGNSITATINGSNVTVSAGDRIVDMAFSSAWLAYSRPPILAGGGNLIAPRSGEQFLLHGAIADTTGSAVTAGAIHFDPFVLSYSVTISQLYAAIKNTAGTALAMAIYSNRDPNASSSSMPAAPLVCGASVATLGSAVHRAVPTNANVLLPAGTRLWGAVCSDGATTFKADLTSKSSTLVGNLVNRASPNSGTVGYRSASSSYVPADLTNIANWPTNPSVSVQGAAFAALGAFAA